MIRLTNSLLLLLSATLATVGCDGSGGGSTTGDTGPGTMDADLDAGMESLDAGIPDARADRAGEEADSAAPEDASTNDAPAPPGDGTADGPGADGALDLGAADGAPDGPTDLGADAAPEPTPCEPCADDDECPSGLCLAFGLRTFCGGDCVDDEDCSEGFECLEVDEGGVLQCVPVDDGLCAACADEDSTCDGVDDDCDGDRDEDYVAIPCGVGACANHSACVEGVETDCVPLEPGPDTDCDGLDDDCDEAVDEGFAEAACGEGACARDPVCEAAEVTCTPGEAFADDATCDGVDDDCDGAVDEDFSTDETCGEGVCVRDAACLEGAVVCEPGPPLAETDVTCDAVDDDCDGAVDDDCQRNIVAFELADVGDGFIDVAVVYRQEHSPTNDGEYWRPRAADLRVVAPDGLTLRLPNNEGVVPGPSVVTSEKRINVIRNDPQTTRLTIISQANTSRIPPGVLCTLRYTHDGAMPPFHFGWNAERTNFAPIEALQVMDVEEADLP